MVATVLEGAKRVTAAPVTHKELFTPEIIRKIHKKLQEPEGFLNLAGRRAMAFILVSYSAFLWCDEAIKLRRSHIAFHKTYMSIFLE